MLAACAQALSDRDVVTDPDRLPTYARDRSTGSEAGEPFAVVFPRTTEQVSAVMAAAHAHAVPVVPRGAGSGLSGGSNAIDGSLIVCLEKMADVLVVNEQDGYVETQPGVLNTDLREHVRGHGLWYAPDPASKDFCSIGGNVNTNAGGLCCVKYGVTREAVLGLEVVLADGRVTRLGPPHGEGRRGLRPRRDDRRQRGDPRHRHDGAPAPASAARPARHRHRRVRGHRVRRAAPSPRS